MLKENELKVTVRDFAAEPDYAMAVSKRLQDELDVAKTIRRESRINFELLHFLARAMSNILILT